MYRFFNANARGNFVNDCVIRAISFAEYKTWDETYKELSILAQDEGVLLDNVEFVEDYLDKRYDRIPHKSKTIKELIEEYPLGTYLITMAGHITVVRDGILYDTFDCSNRKIWSVWEVNKGAFPF